jgi:HEPN domain-containing protein
VELSLKAALKIVAVEYPKKHDVSDVLIQVRNRFPEWFQREIDFMANTSRTLAKKRSISMYGDETFALSPEELVSGEEARIAVENAKKTYSLCRKLLDELKYA